jgi:hypothetical protein
MGLVATLSLVNQATSWHCDLKVSRLGPGSLLQGPALHVNDTDTTTKEVTPDTDLKALSA